jgi:hypothetical protein
MLKPNLSRYHSYLGRFQEVKCSAWKSCCVILSALALFFVPLLILLLNKGVLDPIK